MWKWRWGGWKQMSVLTLGMTVSVRILGQDFVLLLTKEDKNNFLLTSIKSQFCSTRIWLKNEWDQMIFFSYHDNCKDELETYRMANKNNLKTQLYHPKFFLNFVVGLPTSNEIFSAISWWHHRKLFLFSFLNQRLKMFNDT